MKILFDLGDFTDKSCLAEEVHACLCKKITIVHITAEEDTKLNESGYKDSMPTGYFEEESPLFDDEWSRYKCSGIYENIIF